MKDLGIGIGIEVEVRVDSKEKEIEIETVLVEGTFGDRQEDEQESLHPILFHLLKKKVYWVSEGKVNDEAESQCDRVLLEKVEEGHKDKMISNKPETHHK